MSSHTAAPPKFLGNLTFVSFNSHLRLGDEQVSGWPLGIGGEHEEKELRVHRQRPRGASQKSRGA